MAAQYQQRLVGWRRDGNSVLGSTWQELLFDETIVHTAYTVLAQIDFMPKVIAQLEENPEEVVRVFEEITGYRESSAIHYSIVYFLTGATVKDPGAVRVSVFGDVLNLPEPRAPWRTHFADTWMVHDFNPLQDLNNADLSFPPTDAYSYNGAGPHSRFRRRPQRDGEAA